NTTARKIATPDSLYSIAGSSTVIVLPSKLDDVPVEPNDGGGSTVGADELIVTDADEEFWDYFDVTSILPTVVPSLVTLTVEYWDGEAWHAFDGLGPAVGPTTVRRTLSS